MADIRTVDGLDVRAGQLLRHSSGVVVRVTGAARKKVGRDIVNTVQVERVDNGQRGYLDLKAGQSFTVGAGLAKKGKERTEIYAAYKPGSGGKVSGFSGFVESKSAGRRDLGWFPTREEAERAAKD